MLLGGLTEFGLRGGEGLTEGVVEGEGEGEGEGERKGIVRSGGLGDVISGFFSSSFSMYTTLHDTPVFWLG